MKKKIKSKKRLYKGTKTSRPSKKVRKTVTRPKPAVNKIFASDYYKMPDKYNTDTVVIMPVNADTVFVYWEITQKLIDTRSKKMKPGTPNLAIRIYEEGTGKNITSFRIKNMVSSRYVKCSLPFQSLRAEISLKNGRKSIRVLQSGTVPSPVVEVDRSGDEVWMKKIGNMFRIFSVPRAEKTGHAGFSESLNENVMDLMYSRVLLRWR